jgi:hypothetical protein
MTQQEIFDTVVRALGIQGKPAMDGIKCAYRAPDGSKCAAGHLIPDDVYQPEMEGTHIRKVLHSYSALDGLRPHTDLLMDLQDAHDFFFNNSGLTDPFAFVGRARRLAEKYQLNPAVIDEAFPLATDA